MIPRKVKKVIMPWRIWFGFIKESYLDASRYFRAAEFSGWNDENYRQHLEGEIIRRYHVIEKGLSMPDFRPRFGIEMVKRLVSCLERFEAESKDTDIDSSNNNQIIAARAVLHAYYSRHSALEVDVSDFLPCKYQSIPAQSFREFGGTKDLKRVSEEAKIGFLDVVRSRTSVRDFDPERLPDRALIRRAIEVAISSPSVCNRQTWRVHVYEGARAQEMLSFQDGNRGFGHTVPFVLIVTSDMRQFIQAKERYQPWIDGGMFSMTLLLALHAEGLGAISLNWSVLNSQDDAMRRSGGIPEHERVIMLIGCGYAKDGAVVARSLRRPIESIATWDQPQSDEKTSC